MIEKKILEKDILNINGGTKFSSIEDVEKFKAEFPIGTHVSLGDAFYVNMEVTGRIIECDVINQYEFDNVTKYISVIITVQFDESCIGKATAGLTKVSLCNVTDLKKIL